MQSPRNPKQLRVLLDTNILLVGIIWHCFPHAVLMNALNGNFILVETEEKFFEKFPLYDTHFTHLLTHLPYELVSGSMNPT